MLIFSENVKTIGDACDEVLTRMELSTRGCDPSVMHNVRRAMEMLTNAYTDKYGIPVGEVAITR